MKKLQSFLPRIPIQRISTRQSEVLRDKLSDYVAALLEKNAARLSRFEKAQPEGELRAE